LTYTPITPTPVPTETPVPGIYASIAFRGRYIDVNVSNNLGYDVTITRIWVDWLKNHDNQALQIVYTTNQQIWNEGDNEPPTDITSFIGGESLRLIADGTSQMITFQYFNSIDDGSFETTITVYFDTGDSVTVSK